MSEYDGFVARADVKVFDDDHRKKIRKATASHEVAVNAMKDDQFVDWQSARSLAGDIKDAALAELPDLLERFEERISARGVRVLWATNKDEAQHLVLDIARHHHARRVVKTKSMTTEEIDFNELFEDDGIEVWESDLGELIVQLAGEKPYHIVTPAMHKSKDDIAELFHEKLGAPRGAEAEELTMIARAHLRDAYVTAHVGVSGANFIVAEEGAVVMTENEGNGRLTMACPRVHIVVVGIEKVIPSLADLALFLPLLATSGTGQQVTCYNSVIRGPRTPDEPDGPEHMYVVLLDNGRSEIYSRETFRQSLRCIRCGACLNACPVYRAVGGHTYNTTYPGPIGSVITPHLRGVEEWAHLSYASSLCGSCSDVCPVKIDLHHLLLENRSESLKAGGVFWKLAMKMWSLVMRRRWRLRFARRVFCTFEGVVRFLTPKKKLARVPRLARQSFAEIWRSRNGES